jgi:hypothetical protein
MNEYQLRFHTPNSGQHKFRLRYCPWCGGSAPESLRQTFFATITGDEWTRLRKLTADLDSLDQVLSKFGPPDSDTKSGIGRMTRETADSGPIAESFRTLTYGDLSPTAIVRVAVHPDGSAHFSFGAKYIGPPSDQGSSNDS